MVNLGYLYEYGRGVPQSYTRAEGWYRKAVITRVPPAAGCAMAHLGYLFGTGPAVPQSYVEAANWRRKAADSGVGVGMFN